MVSPSSGFISSIDDWGWWLQQEDARKKLGTGKKDQRERWQLRSLHDQSLLGKVAFELSLNLSARYGQADVRLGSIWVDQTPQAQAKYKMPGKRQSTVKCELADLVVVTMVSFGGKPPLAEDSRAVLLQAKVTAIPGMLDGASSRTSTYKERNLLECCSSGITLSSGTGKSSTIGTYDLGCSTSTCGLSRYAQYLTIPKERGLGTSLPYQAMWPYGRDWEDGDSMPLGTMLFDMLDYPSHSMIGQALSGPQVLPDWPRLIRELAALYDKKTVNRFATCGRGPFPRVLHSFLASSLNGTASSPSSSNNGLMWPNMSFAFSAANAGGGGHGEAVRSDREGERGPHLPVLLVHADLGPDGYERPFERPQGPLGERW